MGKVEGAPQRVQDTPSKGGTPLTHMGMCTHTHRVMHRATHKTKDSMTTPRTTPRTNITTPTQPTHN